MNIAKVANELDGQLLKIVTSNMANHFIRIRIYLGMQLQIGKWFIWYDEYGKLRAGEFPIQPYEDGVSEAESKDATEVEGIAKYLRLLSASLAAKFGSIACWIACLLEPSDNKVFANSLLSKLFSVGSLEKNITNQIRSSEVKALITQCFALCVTLWFQWNKQKQKRYLE